MVSSVLSSGDELVECSAASCPSGCVRDSNRPLLLSLLSSAGCAEVVDLGIVHDNEASLSSLLSPGRLSSLDALVCTGGVSMGELDLWKGWLSSHGRLLFGRISMRPGKPTTFALLNRQAADGTNLPGLPFFGSAHTHGASISNTAVPTCNTVHPNSRRSPAPLITAATVAGCLAILCRVSTAEQHHAFHSRSRNNVNCRHQQCAHQRFEL